METKNKGLDYSNLSINSQLQKAIEQIKEKVSKQNLIVEGDLNSIEKIDLVNATRSSKKKLARKIHYCLKSGTRRKTNAMLAFIFKRFLSNENKIIIHPSLEQQVIEKSRKEFKSQLKLMIEKRDEYKKLKQEFKEKGGFYES